jgi:hypothetical protein
MIKTHPSRLALGAVAASLTVLSLAACGGSSPGSSAATSAGAANGAGSTAAAQATTAAGGTASTVHACSLLSAAKASALVGVHYSSATESSQGSMCSYATTNAPIPMFIIISPGAGTAAWKDQLGTIEEDSGSPPITLHGVGDRAAGSGTEIGVQSGSYIIDVHGGDPSGTGAAFPKSIEVAEAIIAALH